MVYVLMTFTYHIVLFLLKKISLKYDLAHGNSNSLQGNSKSLLNKERYLALLKFLVFRLNVMTA